MTLRVAIVDDEPVARRRLRTLLLDESGIEIVGECEDGAAAIAAIERERPDLVFLDVQMPGLDGFDVVEQLAGTDRPIIVFVTAYDQYALKAFDAHAVDYLLKPFERARLRRTLDRARALRAGQTDMTGRLLELLGSVRRERPLCRIAVKANGRIHFVRVEHVDRFEAEGHYVRLHAGRESHLVRGTIASFEQKLDGGQFVRVHRSAIVNLDRVVNLEMSFHGDCIVTLHNGTKITCSRTYVDRLQQRLESGA